MVKVLLLAGLVAGCSNPADWEPQGRVEWVQWREVDDPDGRAGLATALVTNTGRVDIAAMELALRLTTDKESYYVQFHADLPLHPGGSAYQSVAFGYRDASETASLSALRIVSKAFW